MGNLHEVMPIDCVMVGIDLSLNGTGIAIVECVGDKVNIVDTFYIDMKASKTVGLKLQLLWENLLYILEVAHSYAKEKGVELKVCKERPFVSRNFVSVERLYMCHGILELALWEFEVDTKLRVFSAASIKKVVGGSGKSSKEEVAKGIHQYLLYDEDLSEFNDDITDAIAVCITYLIRG